MVLNPILYLTADFCLSFAFWHVKNPSQMKKRTDNFYASDCSVFFNESFLLGIMWNALCFWAKIPECVRLLYFISVWLFSFGNRGESLWSLDWLITPGCSRVSQLCEKKAVQVWEDRSLCHVLVNSSRYCRALTGFQSNNVPKISTCAERKPLCVLAIAEFPAYWTKSVNEGNSFNILRKPAQVYKWMEGKAR